MILTEALAVTAEAAGRPLDVVELRDLLGPDGLDLEISQMVEACRALVDAGVFTRESREGQRSTYRVTGAGSVDKATIALEARRRATGIEQPTRPDIQPSPQRRGNTGGRERREAAVLAAVQERDGTTAEIAKRIGEAYQNVVACLLTLSMRREVVRRPGRKPWTYTIPERMALTGEPVANSRFQPTTPVPPDPATNGPEPSKPEEKPEVPPDQPNPGTAREEALRAEKRRKLAAAFDMLAKTFEHVAGVLRAL